MRPKRPQRPTPPVAELDLRDLEEALAWWRGRSLFFVGGQGKSGTTWVERALDAHPEISCRGEGHLLDGLLQQGDRAISRYSEELDRNNKLFPELAGYPLPDEASAVRMLRGLLLDRLRSAADPDARHIGERTPANVSFLSTIALLFPTASFVHVIRDVRDVAVSVWHHSKRVQPGFDRSLASVAEETAEVWARAMASVRSSGHEQLGARYLELRYEDLLADTAGALGSVVRALGADAGDEIMAAVAEASSFRKLSGRNAGQEDARSHFRAGRAGGWRDALDADTAAKVWAIAGAMLAELGYGE